LQARQAACGSCGAALGPDDVFCGECGTAVTAAPTTAAPPPTAADGERKQLTVLFADVQGSMQL
jgi:class 3 adenylate cyclase